MPQESSTITSKWIINNSSKLQNFLKLPSFFLHSKKPIKNHNKTRIHTHNDKINNADEFQTQVINEEILEKNVLKKNADGFQTQAVINEEILEKDVLKENVDRFQTQVNDHNNKINNADGFQTQVVINEEILEKDVLKKNADGFQTQLVINEEIILEKDVLKGKDGFQTEVINTEKNVQKAVKRLLFGTGQEKENAVQVLISLVYSGDVPMKKLVVELGVIPALVAMVDSDVVRRRCFAIQALIHLADGSFTNKEMIIEAGITSKIPTNIINDEQTTQNLSKLLSIISSSPLNPEKILPFILTNLSTNPNSPQTKQHILNTLLNLSAILENSPLLISDRVIPILLTTLSSSQPKQSETALATLSNLVVTSLGKKALENDSMMPEFLVDVLTWKDNDKSREMVVYVLMVLGSRSRNSREKMAKAGIVRVLLELALLGSDLARKRSLKLLQWFKEDRLRMVSSSGGAHSGPICGTVSRDLGCDEGKRLVKSMVKQSLYRNLEVITNRANDVKFLVVSESSKSLPY